MLLVVAFPLIGEELTPNISYTPTSRYFENMKSPFAPLSREEVKTEWGKELFFGSSFLKQRDYFQAVTSLKRAHLMSAYESIPKERLHQIEYGVIYSYYLGAKFDAAIESYESSSLASLPVDFPAYNDLLIILYDSYIKQKNIARANIVQSLALQKKRSLGKKLTLYKEISLGEVHKIQNERFLPKTVKEAVALYEKEKKSPTQAGFLNAVLPGAGYLYIGQPSTALTSFALNALFIAATIQFFQKGEVAAGIISGGFEAGWYIGGIRGANLGAKQYNNTLYNRIAKEAMMQNKLFPVLMFEYGF